MTQENNPAKAAAGAPAEAAYPRMQPRAKAPPKPQVEMATADDDLNLKIAELREKRTPFGRRQSRLAYPKRPGYHRHWFADHAGRIEEATAAGYEHVRDHEGRIVQKHQGKHKDGRAMVGYLMEIPEVLWKEDRLAQQKGDDLTEQAIRRGVPRGADGKVAEEAGNFYVPSTGISVKRGV